MLGKASAPAAKAAPAPAKEEEEDDDVDLFGSDEESDDEEKKRITEERLKAYHEKKVGDSILCYCCSIIEYFSSGKETESDRENLCPLRCEAVG